MHFTAKYRHSNIRAVIRILWTASTTQSVVVDFRRVALSEFGFNCFRSIRGDQVSRMALCGPKQSATIVYLPLKFLNFIVYCRPQTKTLNTASAGM